MFTSVSLLLFLAAVTADDPRLAQYKYVTKDLREEGSRYDLKENELEYWRSQAESKVMSKSRIQYNLGTAKNVILFLGDGMSIPTITAARIYLGQVNNKSGENSQLSFESFPYTGLSKTYCVNKQVADSACSSTAYLGGVKANYGTLGVTAAVTRGNCTQSGDKRYHVDTVLDWAQAAGKATGLVTTTRITHASPAGHYAHIADRDWESDHNFLTEKHKADPKSCQDIASQLVRNAPGKNCKVLLGGGRSKFLPANPIDPAWGEGERADGESLIKEWQEDKHYRGKAQYVSNKEELLNVDIKHTDYLLGLFQPGHMKYHLQDGSEQQPTLAEMTEVAIKLLRKENRGFYLFVEGGLIDIAHHANQARRALDEVLEFNKAVEVALKLTEEEDTLIVVTADHSHTMTMAGYPRRGDDILGAELKSEGDDQPYPTISYANGPSAEINRTGYRKDISKDDLHDVKYRYPSLVHMDDEKTGMAHGGDDVAVFARGPWAHLLVGNYEQNTIPFAIAYSANMGPLTMVEIESPSKSTVSGPIFVFVLCALSILRLLQ